MEGEATKQEEDGKSGFTPTKRRGGGIILAMLKGGGHTIFCSSFDAVHLSFSHTEGGHKKSPHL